MQYLPARQTVVLVLMDAFQFTTRDAAEVLGTTEGAIHSALFRARGNLRKLAEKGAEEGETKRFFVFRQVTTLLKQAWKSSICMQAQTD